MAKNISTHTLSTAAVVIGLGILIGLLVIGALHQNISIILLGGGVLLILIGFASAVGIIRSKVS